MAQCLHPISVRIDRRRSAAVLYACDKKYVRYKNVRPSLNDVVKVPCGKCIVCLKNRQNALVSRCLAESEKRGTFCFLTLTYNDEHLPLAQSFWRISKETGEVSCVDRGEVVVSARNTRLSGKLLDFKDDIEHIRRKFNSKAPAASTVPRYVDTPIPGFEDEEFEYFSRLTPSVCRQDVRLWLKRARVNFEREHGYKLPDFSYVAVSEYGPNTCRPHYHLAFFGLNCNEAIWLSDSWSYGYKMLKMVNRVNPDGTDGFQIASRYIGKYMTKGKFDCESVLNHSAEKPRICQSIGIGSSLIDKVRSSMCAFDIYGEYDLDTLFCPRLGRSLNQIEVDVLVKEIPKRLCYETGNGFRLPIPRIFREKVFYHLKYHYEKKVTHFDRRGEINSRECLSQTVLRFPTTIWALVSDSIREHLSADDSAKFQSYLSGFGEGEIDTACSEFAYYEEYCAKIAECSHEENYKTFLTHSKF